MAHSALPSLSSLLTGLSWVIRENYVASWVSIDSSRHLEAKYQRKKRAQMLDNAQFPLNLVTNYEPKDIPPIFAT